MTYKREEKKVETQEYSRQEKTAHVQKGGEGDVC